tara:strand:+ start:248313 stop:249647 length:1335 start_codon:yes stop_codon:yes gene_type:complete
MSEFKPLLKLAVPLMASSVAFMGLDIVDTIMMGELGTAQLAAGTLSWLVFILLLMFCIGLSNAVALHIAGAVGAKKNEDISSFFQDGIYLLAITAPALMLAMFFLPDFFHLIHQPQAVVEQSRPFINGILPGMPATLGFLLLRDYSSSMHYPRIIMIITLLSLPLDAALNYILMYGKFGLPALHLMGIGLSTSILEWLMFSAMLIYVYCKKPLRGAIFTRLQKPNWGEIYETFKLGWPIGVAGIFEMGLFTVTAIMMGYLGVTVLAAHEIVIQWTSLGYMFVFGLAQACGIRIAYHIGAKRPQHINLVFKLGLIIGLVIASIFALLFFSIPHTLTDVFLNIHVPHQSAVLIFTQQFFLIAIVFQFFDVLQVVATSSLRGMKDTLVPMFLGLGSYWLVGLISGGLMAFVFGMGGRGLWYGLVLGIAASGLILYWRFQRLLHFTAI